MENLKHIRARIHKQPWESGVGLLFYSEDNSGRVFIAQDVEFQEHCIGEYISNPSVKLSNESAQELMDLLWSVGFRPSEGSGSAGSLRATENHLGDMRKIVEKQLEVEF